MKFNEENIKKLREGKATCVYDGKSVEKLNKIMGTEDIVGFSKYYYFIDGCWSNGNEVIIDELIPLADFFEVELDFSEPYPEYKQPKTAKERDQLIKELMSQINILNDMEFKKVLPSELDEMFCGDLTDLDFTLIKLLRMRDVYRDGWVSDGEKDVNCIWVLEDEIQTDCLFRASISFSFQDKEIAVLFLTNFKEELESVKHLIS
jgi:diadenosine tetraphosphatase ApaH/serine/threonine PP2A family protein phosphatase